MKKIYISFLLLVMATFGCKAGLIITPVGSLTNISQLPTNAVLLITIPGITNYQTSILQFESWLANDPNFVRFMTNNPSFVFGGGGVSMTAATNTSSVVWTN